MKVTFKDEEILILISALAYLYDISEVGTAMSEYASVLLERADEQMRESVE